MTNPYVNLSDAIFDDMIVPCNAERMKFLLLCRKSFACIRHLRTDIEGWKEMNCGDWKVFVALLVQMGFVDLNGNSFCRELEAKKLGDPRVEMIEDGWNFATDKHGRISILHLEPRGAIPSIIHRLEHLQKLYITGQTVKALPIKELCSIPRLLELKMDFDIMSLKVIADQISDQIPSEEPFAASKSLRRLMFVGSENWEKVYEDSETKAALQTILDFFITIDTVRINRYDANTSCKEDWEYALLKNKVGRRILEEKGYSNDGDESSSLPLSIWPTMLERAQMETGEESKTVYCNDELPRAQQETNERAKATGIYYLLREGPVLFTRPTGYVCASIEKVEEYLATEFDGIKLENVHSTTYCANRDGLEHDSATKLNRKLKPFFESRMDDLRGIVQLGRTDISSRVSALESQVASPRQEDLEEVFRIYSYLKDTAYVRGRVQNLAPYVDDNSRWSTRGAYERYLAPRTNEFDDDCRLNFFFGWDGNLSLVKTPLSSQPERQPNERQPIITAEVGRSRHRFAPAIAETLVEAQVEAVVQEDTEDEPSLIDIDTDSESDSINFGHDDSVYPQHNDFTTTATRRRPPTPFRRNNRRRCDVVVVEDRSDVELPLPPATIPPLPFPMDGNL